ncbi:MAG TPA: YCF48-related protein [Oscillatoriaceae cyanobacterium]
MRVRLAILIGLWMSVAACTPDTTPTGVQSSAGPSGPTITSLSATPSGTGIVTLDVQATDDAGGALSYQWSASQGQLSATTGPSVLWRVPTQAGNYTATVQVTDGAGISRTATQQFQVSGSGQAVAQGQTQIGSVVLPNGQTVAATGVGQFQVASPVPFSSPSIDAIGANPNAPGTAAPTPPPGFEQPVATPAPGTTPATPPPVPIATPSLTPPPATPAPSPLPASPQPTPQPLTSQHPPSAWEQVPSGSTATSGFLDGVSFPSADGTFQNGWACGSNSIIHSTDGGASWAAQAAPAGVTFNDIVFGDDSFGYVLASEGKVFRTSDGGNTWVDISPTIQNFNWNSPKSIALYNDGSVVMCTDSGLVLRNDAANGSAAAASTAWTEINTNAAPPGRLNAVAVCASAGTLNTAYFAGDNGVYEMDSTAGSATPWKLVLSLASYDKATAVSVTSATDVWVGTQSGTVYHSTDGGSSWNAITALTNAMSNGVQLPNGLVPTLNPGTILDMSFVDSNNGWMTLGGRVLNTSDGGRSWTEIDLPAQVTSLQVNREVVNGAVKFLGWGVGPSGVVFRYVPTF